MNQQIIQIHWIDALINSYPGGYKFLKFFNFLNPSKKTTKSKHLDKIIDLLHDEDSRSKMETKAAKVVSRTEVPQDLLFKLDALCVE